MKSWQIIALSLAAVATVAAAQDTKPASSQPENDLLRGCIEPFNPGPERTRFLRAAGVDNEMNEEEFNADAKRTDGFVRSFDRWATLKAHDKNANGTIDWFEAQAYREDIRKQLLEGYDENRDGRLTGPERAKAQEALLAGRIRRPTSRPARTGWEMPEEMVKKHDADGDGKLSDEERRAAWREMQEQRAAEINRQYDADGDGQLSEEERRAMRREQRRQAEENSPLAKKGRELLVASFDTDGDGELNEEEEAAAAQYRRRLEKIGDDLRNSLMDTDGDGKVSEEEQRAAAGKMMVAGMAIMRRFQQAADTDGDGQVSAEERRAQQRSIETGMAKWLEDTTNSYDSNADGRLDADERDKMVEGIRGNFQKKVAAADADGDGDVSAEELQKLFLDLSEEMGTLPKSDATEESAG